MSVLATISNLDRVPRCENAILYEAKQSRVYSVVAKTPEKLFTNDTGWYKDQYKVIVLVLQCRDDKTIFEWRLYAGLVDARSEVPLTESMLWIAKHGDPAFLDETAKQFMLDQWDIKISAPYAG